MPTEPTPSYQCQKAHIIPKGTFNNMINPAAGPARRMTTRMMQEILHPKEGGQLTPFPCNPPIPKPGDDATADKWVILHRCKTLNEELLIRLKDDAKKKRPAIEFSHYPITLFDEIIKTPYNPIGIQLIEPLSFTFYLSYLKTGVPDVLFSVRYQIKGTSSDFIELFFGNSVIPGVTHKEQPEKAPSSKAGAGHATSNKVTMTAVPATDDDNNDERKGIAASHSIRSDAFQRCLDNYWNGLPVPDPFPISWTVLQSLLEANTGKEVRLLWEDDHHSNDMDLGFEDDPYADVPAQADTETNNAMTSSNPEKTSYSIKLFNGIRSLNGTYQIRLYKGQNDDGTKTVLIESIGTTGHSYYDLNGLHP